MSLEEEVLAKIRPTRSERDKVRDVARELVETLEKAAQRKGIPAEPILVGSVAKDTFLKNPEIDVFVAFPPKTSREELERWGLELGKVLDHPTRRYAEHPFTHGFFRNHEADVVPCYKLDKSSARMTAVDRTPFHLEYVRESLQEGQKDEVRLLKQFTKGIAVYGAEARVQGFSGYLCELLILKFGTFKQLLQAAKRWRPRVQLQLEMGPARAFEEPLVFVDPVDGERNAASAVSIDSLATFIHAAREYLREPSEAFFFPEIPAPWSVSELKKEMKKRGTLILAVSSTAPDLPEDVLYPQLRKAEQATLAYLSNHDFRVFRSEPFLLEGDWCVLLEVEVSKLPGVKKHLGPPPWLKNAYSFTRKWESSPDRVAGPYVEEGRLVVDVRRTHVDAAQALGDGLPDLSLGKHLDEAVRGGYKILRGEEIIDTGYVGILTTFLRREFPWRATKSR
ncbi:MAG: CCA tRNA nucleotidyltransferase [Thermoplasmata archaeon]